MLNYSRSELRPRRHNPNKRERFYPVTCTRCHTERWLRKSDAIKATGQCGRCQRSDAGKLGYKATAERYGSDFAIKFLQRYRLANPSQPEQEVIALLDLLCVDYEREFRFDAQTGDRFLLDFVVKFGDKPEAAIQVNGWQHTRDRMVERDRKLAEVIPYPLLTLDVSQTNKINPREVERFLGAIGW